MPLWHAIEESRHLIARLLKILRVWSLEGSGTGTKNKRSRKGQQADALALEGEEGRDKLRKAPGRCK